MLAVAQSLSTITISPGTITGGGSATGKVTLTSGAPASGTTVALSSAATGISFPPSVTFTSGQTVQTFSITTNAVATDNQDVIAATLGNVRATATLKVLAPQVNAFSFTPTNVTGGSNLTGQITLSGKAPAAGMTVKLSSNSGALKVPATMTVSGGAIVGTFTAMTGGVTSATTASATAVTTQTPLTASMTITPVTVKSVKIFPFEVPANTSTTGTVTLTGVAPTGGIKVGLKSNATYATPDVSVTVPAGATSANFNVTTAPPAATSTATITATYANKSVTTTLVVDRVSQLANSAWPKYNNGPTNRGSGGGSGSTGASTVTLAGVGTIIGSPIISADGKTVYLDNGTNLIALDVSNPLAITTKFTFALVGGTGAVGKTPLVVANGNIYATEGNTTGIDIITPSGTQQALVASPTGAAVGTPALAYDGSVIFGNDSGILSFGSPTGGPSTNLNLKTGAIDTAPAVDSIGRTFVSSQRFNSKNAGTLASVLAAVGSDRSLLWSVTLTPAGSPPSSTPTSSPSIGRDTNVYVVAHNQLLAYDRATGNLMWTYSGAAAGDIVLPFTPAIGLNGEIYVATQNAGSNTGSVVSLKNDGTTNWVQALLGNDIVQGDFTIDAADVLYFGTQTGFIALASNDTPLWAVPIRIGANSSAIVDATGRLMFIDNTGTFTIVN